MRRSCISCCSKQKKLAEKVNKHIVILCIVSKATVWKMGIKRLRQDPCFERFNNLIISRTLASFIKCYRFCFRFIKASMLISKCAQIYSIIKVEHKKWTVLNSAVNELSAYAFIRCCRNWYIINPINLNLRLTSN